MILKEIRINGFKSFADKTVIKLEKGIIGVVGPNGSGKSNIADAIRWVLGEQSVKSLRGENGMLDIVFAGSKSRKASPNASVALVFDNSDHFFRVSYNEIEIKRIIYASGENEYFLNKEKCRLKDITDLLIDSSVGKDSFNIISQGNVQEVLSGKAEDRRTIFESAAGVLKYKKRKEEATKRLDKAHDNLNRVNDIINELLLQIEPLQKQKEKAEIYLNDKKELESVEIALITDEITSINNNYEISKKEIEIINNELLQKSTSYTNDDTEIQKLKTEFSKENVILQDKQQELVKLTENAQKLNSELELLKERSKYDAKDIKVHNNILNLKEELLKKENLVSSLKDKVDLFTNNLNELQNKNIKFSNELNIIKVNKSNKNNEIINLQGNILRKNHEIDILKESIKNNDILPFSVKSILNSNINGIVDVIANLIEVDNKYSVAVQVALLASSNYVVVENESVAKKSIEFLKKNNLGRVTFFPLNVIKPKAVDPNAINKIKNDPSYIDVLSNVVSYDDKYRNIILNQLGNVILASDIDGANRISKTINCSYRIVTLDGELVGVGGSITGGTLKKTNSVIEEKKKLDEVTNHVKKLNNDVNRLQEEYEVILKSENDYFIKLETNQREISELSINLTENKNKLNSLNDELESIRKEYESLSDITSGNVFDKENELLEEYYKLLSSKESIENEIETLKNNINNISDDINILEHKQRENNSEINKKQSRLKELEISIGRMDVKIENYLNILNNDYSMTYEYAKDHYSLVIPYEDAQKKVDALRKEIKELGDVNVNAIEEYERVKTRYDFLDSQKNDLYDAENTLLNIISEMDSIMKSDFEATFNKVKVEFKNVFKELFSGGDADLKLTNPDDLLTTGIDIIAHPPGKKMQHISLLSGGEKALTAISLLFAILRVKPVPFCLLDEVEAPLDEVNVNTFGKYLTKITDNTQFIVITHKKKTMEYANILYGITMQESGVSKLVSVKLEDLK